MRRRHTLLLAALAALMLLASSAHAQAGDYEVAACNDAEGINNSWVWATSDPSHPSHYAEHTNCPDRLGGNGGRIDQEGGLSTTDELGLSNGAPPSTSAGWTFTAPAGTTIAGITYERYIGHIFDSSNYWSPALRADGAVLSGETCLDTIENSESCFVGGPPGEGGKPGVVTGLSAHQLELGILCEAHAEEECITGATEHKAWAAMYGATVTISDPTPPTLRTPTGTLWEPSETGFHTGTQGVAIAAEDVGGGMQSIELAADGHPLQTYTASCDFTRSQPCPSTTGTQNFTLPTTLLSDGVHTLTLTATDTAGNQTTTSQQITIVNNPPPPPTELTATPTQAGSTTFTTTWVDPAEQVAPITAATYQICPAIGPGVCSTPTTAPARGPVTVTVPGPGTWTLAVWLTNAAGLSSSDIAAHATLTVPTSTSPPSAAPGSESLGGDSGNGTSSTLSHSDPPKKMTIHLAEALRGYVLIVHVSGPATGTVRVSYTGRYRHQTIASATKRVALRHGGLTTTFRLSARTARYATIRVYVRLDKEAAVGRTLHRTRRATSASRHETAR